MLDEYVTRRGSLRRHRAGLFGAHPDTYTSMLTEQGYRPDSVRSHSYLVRIFGQWLERRGLTLVDLDDGVIMPFWRKERRRQWRVRSVVLKPLQHMLVHLRSQGVVREPSKPKLTEAEALVHRAGLHVLDVAATHSRVVCATLGASCTAHTPASCARAPSRTHRTAQTGVLTTAAQPNLAHPRRALYP